MTTAHRRYARACGRRGRQRVRAGARRDRPGEHALVADGGAVRVAREVVEHGGRSRPAASWRTPPTPWAQPTHGRGARRANAADRAPAAAALGIRESGCRTCRRTRAQRMHRKQEPASAPAAATGRWRRPRAPQATNAWACRCSRSSCVHVCSTSVKAAWPPSQRALAANGERGRAASQQRLVHPARVMTRQRIELVRQREHQVRVGHVEQFGQRARRQASAACFWQRGQWRLRQECQRHCVGAAGIAGRRWPPSAGSAAGGDRAPRPGLCRAQAVARQIRRPEARQHLGQCGRHEVAATTTVSAAVKPASSTAGPAACGGAPSGVSGRARCRYRAVVLTCRWPSHCEMLCRSTPASSRCVASSAASCGCHPPW